MNALDDVIDAFTRLPGIGKKSAARISYHLLSRPEHEVAELAHSISVLHERIHACPLCAAFTEHDPCDICSDPHRDKSLLCVVEHAQDVTTLSRISEYRGLFHVLGGVIAPLDGIGPENLRIGELIQRIKKGDVKEVIFATNPTMEGDTTALYIQNLLQEYPIEITRLASGLPAGGDLEYTDTLTLVRSLRGRSGF